MAGSTIASGAAAGALVCPVCNTRYPADSKFCTHDGSPLVASTANGDPLIGTVIADRYRIVRLLGEGGMGRVYEASHLNIAKRYALKLLRPNVLDNPEAIVRFRQEAWAASSIGHPNIISIDDFATLPDGGVYLAMEFLDGESLAARMQARPQTLGEILHVMAQVVSALAAAHDKGIVHRDIKPENIFLAKAPGGAGEIVKLLDFGIAKVTDTAQPHLTKTGAVFGTPYYMSPEQALGRSLDHRTDIYSTGVILYELAVGHVPFQAESFLEVLHHHISTEPKSPSLAAPGRVDAGLEAIIARAMAKDRDQRYASMAELFAALQELGERVLGIDPATLGQTYRPPTGPMRGATPSGPAPVSTATPSQPSQPALGRVSVPPRNSSTSGAPSLPPGAAGTALPPTTTQPPTTQPAEAPKKTSGTSVVLLALIGLGAIGVGAGGIWWWKQRAIDPAQTAATTATSVASATPNPNPTTPPNPTPNPTPTPTPNPNATTPVAKVEPKVARPEPKTKPEPKPGKVDPKTKPGSKPEATTQDWPDPPPPPPRRTEPPPPRPGQPIDPYAQPSRPIPVAPMRPTPPPPASVGQPLGSSLVDQEVGRRMPGMRRVGAVLKGQVAEEDGRNDYTVQLESGRCYTLFTTGGQGVREISLYLWNPLGKRAATHRSNQPQATFMHCTVMPGPYHVQVKVTEGTGETQLGVYTR